MRGIKEISCKTALNRLSKSRLPYNWDLNVYRGCAHGCEYCYALYSHGYINGGSFFGDIYVKTNAAERLEEQLAARSWRREAVNLGGVTDSYQPAEAEYKIMPDILRLLIKYKTPCIISTKSTLITRDIALFEELSRIAYVCVSETVTCMDESVRIKLEPGGAPSDKRFDVLKEFAGAGIRTGLHYMPIVPYVTDGRRNMEEIFSRAAEVGVSHVIAERLNLRGETRGRFLAFLESSLPDALEPVKRIYSGEKRKEYSIRLRSQINYYMKKYGLSPDYMEGLRPKDEYKQLTLFD